MSITLRSRRGAIGTSWHAVALRETGEQHLGPGRVGRGKAAARAGEVQWLDVAPGVARGDVQDATGEIHQARLELPVVRFDDRGVLLGILHAHPDLPARLAAGQYPHQIEEELAANEVALLPGGAELSHDCSCLDWPGPCRHVAALLFVLVEAVDVEPLLLLRWRGLELEDLVPPAGPASAAAAAARPSAGAGSSPGAAPSARSPRSGGEPASPAQDARPEGSSGDASGGADGDPSGGAGGDPSGGAGGGPAGGADGDPSGGAGGGPAAVPERGPSAGAAAGPCGDAGGGPEAGAGTGPGGDAEGGPEAGAGTGPGGAPSTEEAVSGGAGDRPFDPARADPRLLAEVMGAEVAAIVHGFFGGSADGAGTDRGTP